MTPLTQENSLEVLKVLRRAWTLHGVFTSYARWYKGTSWVRVWGSEWRPARWSGSAGNAEVVLASLVTPAALVASGGSSLSLSSGCRLASSMASPKSQQSSFGCVWSIKGKASHVAGPKPGAGIVRESSQFVSQARNRRSRLGVWRELVRRARVVLRRSRSMGFRAGLAEAPPPRTSGQ